MVRDQNGSGILHLGNKFQNRIGALMLQDSGNLVTGRVSGKLRRYGIEQKRDSSSRIYFPEVIFIKGQDISFHLIHLSEIIGFDIFCYSLGHSAYEHIQAEIPHQLSVKLVAERFFQSEGFLQQPCSGIVAGCP